MFLKKIEIQGFKSFADKTQIEFQSGITGVVGPNGSGKSNISDAIRWVLGEQSAKSLRGSKMEDIVFAGTEKRKPLGFAEVTLILDNSKKQLDIEYSEVSVTRRVFRSGESEYYINKNSCRLRDVKELFMDTGIGEDGYSIIGQGKIDEILSSKSQDRRNIFEEAAGIVKYKSRKAEAEKKLGKTEENLLRINDIVEELEKQIKPLKTQSKQAVEYKEISGQLKKIQINLYLYQIMAVKQQLKQIDLQREKSKDQLKNKQQGKEKLDEKYNQLKTQIDKINSDIEQTKTDRYDTKAEIEKTNNDISLINQKISYLKKEITRYEKEIVDLEEYIELSQEEKTTLVKQEDTQEKQIQKLNSDIDKKTIEFKDIKNEMEKKDKFVEDKKSDVIETFNIIADKKSKSNSLNSFKENVDKRLKQIEEELFELDDSSKHIKTQIIQLKQQIDEYQEILDKITERLNNMISDRDKENIRLEKTNREINDIGSKLQSSKSRYKLLSDMSREYEGYYKGVKNALKACSRDENLGRGVEGVLAELIDVPKKYEKAVEVALGSSIQNIVIDTQENARDIINYLKSNNLGRVTFLPLSSISSRYLSNNEKKLLDENGAIGVGSDLLNYNNKYKNIIENLLGRVLFVEKLEDGISIAQKCNYSMRIISLDGDVLNPGGSMTGGSLNNYNTKLLGRQREIDQLKQEIEELSIRYNTISKEKEKLVSDIEALDKNILKDNEIINNTRLDLSSIEAKYNQACEENQRNKKLRDKFNSEVDNLVKENSNIEKDIENIAIELKKLQDENKEIQDNIEIYIVEYQDEKSKQENKNTEITELKVVKASLLQEHRNIKEEIERLSQEIKKSLSNKSLKIKEKQAVYENINKLKQEISAKQEEKTNIEKQLKDYNQKLEKTTLDKQNYIKKFVELENQLKAINIEIDQDEKACNALNFKRERHDIQYENTNNRLWEEYELSFQMALTYKQDIEDLDQAKDQVKKLKAKIKSLGHINLNAIEEYKNVKQRYEFMTSQIEDLTYAKDSLDKVIEEMHTKMTQQFTESFKMIRENFIQVFGELFGGGKADVYLIDESDILNSGVEIVAQPPGKKLQNLSLLSGGERALTAIALLFAIIKTKPTPFCVLDEIEAALDESNVYRFADYLKRFSDTTQFITITHRKGTMENVDTLYGVTMEEEGVSQLVSIRLSKEEKVS